MSEVATMEELESFSVSSEDKSKALEIGKELSDHIKGLLKKFRAMNLNVFAWKYDDIVGIDPEVAYKL